MAYAATLLPRVWPATSENRKCSPAQMRASTISLSAWENVPKLRTIDAAGGAAGKTVEKLVIEYPPGVSPKNARSTATSAPSRLRCPETASGYGALNSGVQVASATV